MKKEEFSKHVNNVKSILETKLDIYSDPVLEKIIEDDLLPEIVISFNSFSKIKNNRIFGYFGSANRKKLNELTVFQFKQLCNLAQEYGVSIEAERSGVSWSCH